jgi:hypothetical protein
MKAGRFSDKGVDIPCCGLFTLKGSIQGKESIVVINVDDKDNYINIDLANQLLILEPNIIEKEDIFHKKQYEIKNLLVKNDDYEEISQFKVANMYKK